MTDSKHTTRYTIKKHNLELINNYIQDKKSIVEINKTTEKNIKNYLTVLEKSIKKPFDFKHKITEEDITKHLEKRFKLSSRGIIICYIKDFARFIHKLEKDDKLPESLRRIKQPTKKQLIKIQDPTTAHKALTQIEIEQIIEKGTSHPMEKALVETLYLFGCRPSELLAMNIEHVKEDTERSLTSIIITQSKTIPREITTEKNPIYLLDWLNSYHPYKNKTDFPLWLSKAPRNLDGRLTVSGVNKIIKRMAKKAEINKNVFPYMLRHSSVTQDRKERMSTPDLETKYGWIKGTQMLQTYDHNGIEEFKENLLKNTTMKVKTYTSLINENKEIASIKVKHEKELKELKNELETVKETVNLLYDEKEFEETRKEQLEFKKDREEFKLLMKLLKEGKENEIIELFNKND